ncbi:MAG: hypothetical protein JWQ43_2879 [Glaciihabitans sp.]|nr:hypothetical protein [Glaciihabitans sp.]
MARYVALLRGINVGTAARISMPELRDIVSSLGYTGVRTHLQSGNVVFDSGKTLGAPAVTELESLIATRTGVSPRVVLVTADRFREIANENPLVDVADPARMVITFLDPMPDVAAIDRPSDTVLAPERLEIGRFALYQWLPDGVLKTKLPPRFAKQLGPAATARNLRTVSKVLAMLDED